MIKRRHSEDETEKSANRTMITRGTEYRRCLLQHQLKHSPLNVWGIIRPDSKHKSLTPYHLHLDLHLSLRHHITKPVYTISRSYLESTAQQVLRSLGPAHELPLPAQSGALTPTAHQVRLEKLLEEYGNLDFFPTIHDEWPSTYDLGA